MRVVVDTDVMVAGIRSDRGASRQILLRALDRHIVVLASVPLMLEYEAVLTRADHLDGSGLTVEQVNDILDAFAAVAEPVSMSFLWRPQLKDSADEMVLETAINGHADGLITLNVRHFSAAARLFGVRVIRPGDFCREIRGAINEKE